MCPASLFFWMQLVIRDIGANWHNKWRVKRHIPMSQVQRRKLGWLIFLGLDNPFFAENNGDQSDTLRAGTLSLLHLSCQR
jgi:hypothetical protein